jgi:hypothetical protein
MSEVTREEFDALKARVDKLDVIVTPPTAAMTISASPGPGPGQVTVDWTIPESWVPIKVRAGRNGIDSKKTGPWSEDVAPSTRRFVFNNLLADTEYTFTIVAEIEGKSQVEVASVSAKPKAGQIPPVDPPAGERKVKLVGHSRQPFNLVAFSGGDMPLKDVQRNENIVGNALDGAMMFTGRNNWDAFRSGSVAAAARSNLQAGKIHIITMSHAPETIGTTMNVEGAKNSYRDEQRKIGEWLQAEGIDDEDVIVRLDHEWNGDWYKWSAKYGGNAALRDAMGHYIDNIRESGATKVQFELCCNVKSGAPFGTWENVIPGNGYFNILSIDEYDAYPPVRNTIDWEAHMSQPLSIRQGIKIAKRNNAMFAVDECGAMHHGGGGYDNPAYWGFLYKELVDNADHISHMTIYNHDGAPATNKHSWIYNPKGLAEFRRILTDYRKA